MFRGGRQHLKDAAERASQSAKRSAKDAAERAFQSARRSAVELSREQYERVKAYIIEAFEYPVITFHGDSEHDDFVYWIHENPSGFVINRASDMLHRADCSAFVFHDPSYCLTTHKKVCAPSKDRLEHWGEWRVWVHLEYCSRCRP